MGEIYDSVASHHMTVEWKVPDFRPGLKPASNNAKITFDGDTRNILSADSDNDDFLLGMNCEQRIVQKNYVLEAVTWTGSRCWRLQQTTFLEHWRNFQNPD